MRSTRSSCSVNERFEFGVESSISDASACCCSDAFAITEKSVAVEDVDEALASFEENESGKAIVGHLVADVEEEKTSMETEENGLTVTFAGSTASENLLPGKIQSQGKRMDPRFGVIHDGCDLKKGRPASHGCHS